MIKDRFNSSDEKSPYELLQEKITNTPVWDEFTPEEQERLKEMFLNHYHG